MAYDNQKPGTGLIGKNKHFNAERRTPHMTGHIFAHRDIKAGERIELSLWKWQSRPEDGFTVKAGDPRSLSEEAFGNPSQLPSQQPDKRLDDDLDDSIPF